MWLLQQSTGEGFSILGHWNYSLNNQGPCLFPFLLSTIPIFSRISILPGAEADTHCRILRLVIWGRQRASVTAVLSPKPFLDSLEESEMKCYWQWGPEPHSSPVCHPQDLWPPFLTHMCLGLCWKDPTCLIQGTLGVGGRNNEVLKSCSRS